MPMPISSRLYQCGRCHAQVIVCRRCDRGQRYCAKGCSQAARKESLQRAGKAYQATRIGRVNNAARQCRFRQRQKQKEEKVTHQRSFKNLLCDLLQNKPEGPEKASLQPGLSTILYCHHCGAECGHFLRSHFLHSNRFNRVLR